jgi:hypothetical protein
MAVSKSAHSVRALHRNLPQAIPVQPVAPDSTHIIVPWAQSVLQPAAEHALIVWCVAVGAVRRQGHQLYLTAPAIASDVVGNR